MSNNRSTGSKNFIDGFLVKDGRLIIKPSGPSITRISGSLARMSGYCSGVELIKDLIGLIQSQETTHVYLSSESKNGASRLQNEISLSLIKLVTFLNG